MNIGLLQVSVKQQPRRKPRAREGFIAKNYCVLMEHCREGGRIQPGTLHAIIVQGNREGKKWYKRLHLECLPRWAEYSYNWRRRPRGGDHGGRRPVGSGPLAVMDEGERKARNRLIRERARLLRCFADTWEPEKCAKLWERIRALQARVGETGIVVQKSAQGRRDPRVKKAIEEKAERLGLTQ